jgi:hypothetical protein
MWYSFAFFDPAAGLMLFVVDHRRGCAMIFWWGGKFASAQRHVVEDFLDSLDTILLDCPDEITVLSDLPRKTS